MILIIDNYDSFTYNLYQMTGELFADINDNAVLVRRNDEISIDEIGKLPNLTGIIISPGPGYPDSAGVSLDAVKAFSGKVPILGVCLGHQAICQAFGGKIVKAPQLMHGKGSVITLHDGVRLFRNLPNRITAARYHSLCAEPDVLPDCLSVIAEVTDDNARVIMGVKHVKHETYGVQFHPESILTRAGKFILGNFLDICGERTKSVSQYQIYGELDLPKTSLKPYIAKTVDRINLTAAEAEDAMKTIMDGMATDAQIAALLASLRMKGETAEEITGFARGMRAKAVRVEDCEDAVDIVGTGGDLAGTFNVSTTSAFVTAAAGVPVAKHGNRSVSSKSGAADVLEALGAFINTDRVKARDMVKSVGVSFLFAPGFHGSMRFAGPARRDTGIRTVFNILGPLINPAFTNYIVLGVYDGALLPVMSEVLQNLGIKKALLVYGTDGLDEASVSAPTLVYEVTPSDIIHYELSPSQLGFPEYEKSEIVGGTPADNAEITRGILRGEIRGAKRDIVLLNSGLAIYCTGKAKSVKDGIDMARETIDSGAALVKLDEYILASKN